MTYVFSKHFETRMNQRGLRKEDIDILLNIADRIAPDAYLMTNEVTDQEIARRKREIQQLERLRGKKLIVEGKTVITGYHARQRNQKITFEKGRDYA